MWCDAYCYDVSTVDPTVCLRGYRVRGRRVLPRQAGYAQPRRVLEQEVQPRTLGGVQGEAVQGNIGKLLSLFATSVTELNHIIILFEMSN